MRGNPDALHSVLKVAKFTLGDFQAVGFRRLANDLARAADYGIISIATIAEQTWSHSLPDTFLISFSLGLYPWVGRGYENRINGKISDLYFCFEINRYP